MGLRQSKRSYSSFSIAGSKFFQRDGEISSMNRMLRPVEVGAPGKVMAIFGPQSSGKTALIREFRRKQERGEVAGVSAYVDLRQQSDDQEVARVLWESMGTCLEEKVRGGMDLKLLGRWGMSYNNNCFEASTPGGSVRVEDRSGESLACVFEAIQDYSTMVARVLGNFTGMFPTVFLDEADVLLRDEEEADPEYADDVMRKIVRTSKQECGANFVLISSKSHSFQRWLDMSPAAQCLTTKTVGYFAKEEAKDFVGFFVQDSERMKEVDAIWDDVYEHIGGGPLQLWDLVAVVKGAPVGRMQQECQRWKSEQVFTALARLKALAMNRYAKSGEEFLKVVEKMAKQPGGCVSYSALTARSEHTIQYMLDREVLHYRTYGCNEDFSGVATEAYPIVMPANRLQFMAMKRIFNDPGLKLRKRTRKSKM